MKFSVFVFLIFMCAGVFAQTKDFPETVMTAYTEFDTLRQVGYPYVFGADNPAEYYNDIDYGTLSFTRAKVNIVSYCIYETYFENSVVKSLKLFTDNKKATSELRLLATLICPEFTASAGDKGLIRFQTSVYLNDKLCLVSYFEDKHSKNAVFEVKLENVVLN